MKHLIIILAILFVSACNKDQNSRSHKIIEDAVLKHGAKNFDDIDVSFEFRNFHYHIASSEGQYQYDRSFKDSLGNVTFDKLKNGQFERKINGIIQELSTKEIDKYKESTNSVAYFVLLPYKLLDTAVYSTLIGTSNIDGQAYNKVKVWFNSKGGGKDHDDVFTYWFNKETKMLDYLAYDNGGPRFRKATKRNTFKGIVFQDYENYEILDKSIPTWKYYDAFLNGKAKLLSKIEQTNYK